MRIFNFDIRVCGCPKFTENTFFFRIYIYIFLNLIDYLVMMMNALNSIDHQKEGVQGEEEEEKEKEDAGDHGVLGEKLPEHQPPGEKPLFKT